MRGNKVLKLLDPASEELRGPMVAKIMTEDNYESDEEVLVKFTNEYSEEAPRTLAEANLAPKLYNCWSVLGWMTTAILEYLKDWERMDSSEKGELGQPVRVNIEDAVKRLRDRRFDHGDLRAMSVMVDPKGKQAKAADFD